MFLNSRLTDHEWCTRLLCGKITLKRSHSHSCQTLKKPIFKYLQWTLNTEITGFTTLFNTSIVLLLRLIFKGRHSNLSNIGWIFFSLAYKPGPTWDWIQITQKISIENSLVNTCGLLILMYNRKCHPPVTVSYIKRQGRPQKGTAISEPFAKLLHVIGISHPNLKAFIQC